MSRISDLRKKKNQAKKQLQEIAFTEGQDWRNIVLEEKLLRQKFLQQWKKHSNGKSNEFFAAASQYASIVSREKKARDILDAKFKPHLKQIIDLDYKIQKAKNKKTPSPADSFFHNNENCNRLK